ncbi:MAG TPA: GNAT family N-acetyltransferase [Gaiellaceae bacterium]|nr:GNAT family N-acetyltransferase [Gaiellaceae bacterium]
MPPLGRKPRLRVVPVTAERWDDMVTLFERRGPRGGYRNVPAYGCWCMYWRDRSIPHGEGKKRAMEELVCAGREPGLLAYGDGEPVGWVSLGPRQDFPALLRSPQYRPREEGGGDAVWSLVCFAVDKDAQRHGVARELLAAAVAHAFARGASSLEAYPHKTEGTNYMGHVGLFETAGFTPVRETSKRVIMRIEP